MLIYFLVLKECLPRNQIFFEDNTIKDLSNTEYNDNHMPLPPLYDYIEETNKVNDVKQIGKARIDADYSRELKKNFLKNYHKKNMKRSLELVEEQPPEGTIRSPVEENVNRNNPGIELTTMPIPMSLPQSPTIPSLTPKTNPVANDETTTLSPDVETITEDYSDFADPKCDYDVMTFVLKCGLNLITSIFGLSDTCCPSIF